MILDRILYFHAAQAERLLHDTVIEILLPLQARGITQIDGGSALAVARGIQSRLVCRARLSGMLSTYIWNARRKHSASVAWGAAALIFSK
jgi:hypothetical protein